MSLISHIGTFVVGGIAGGFLTHFGEHLFDLILGRINVEVMPNPRAGIKYHGYYIASETKNHKQEINIFAISCDINNHSKDSFVIKDYSIYVQPNEKNEWIILNKRNMEEQCIKPLPNLSISLLFKNFTEDPIMISKLINKPILGKSIRNIIFVASKHLNDLRLNREDYSLNIKLVLKERRGKTFEKVFSLKRICFRKNSTGTHFEYCSDENRETIEGSSLHIDK